MPTRQELALMADAPSWTVTGLATAFLALRLWARKYRHSGLWYDDYMLIASWAVLIMVCSLQTAMFSAGYMGSRYGKTLFKAALSTGSISTAWSKTAFALTLFSISKHWAARVFLWASVLGLNVICYICAVGLWARSCDEPGPSVGQSTSYLPGPCWSVVSFSRVMMVQAVYAGIMDLAFAIFPWAVIWRTKLERREKVGLCIVMSLGILAVGVIGIRIAYLAQLSHSSIPELVVNVARICVTGVAEPCATIIAQSLPVFRALVRGAREETRLSTGSAGDTPMPVLNKTPSPRNVAEGDPFGVFSPDDDMESGVRLVKRADGRIVAESSAEDAPPPPRAAVQRTEDS
ncbi:hypothetical protein F4780DRAFT_550640 [Xylariomycetidae sp. FL0641]|nr:hypothetical protein F4780DRAFT_550640 [Xylariomycetidae sp. FL0641]